MTQIYDKSITQSPISCMKLLVSPENKDIADSMNKLYAFDDKCKLKLEVSYKGDIHCNSNQNADRKALSAFPQSYLRMELRTGLDLQYSYYIDLSGDIDADALKSAFEKIQKELNIK